MDKFSEIQKEVLDCLEYRKVGNLRVVRVPNKQNELAKDQITVSIESVPFFLSTEHNHHVAGEVEVETTNIICEGGITVDSDGIVTSCQLGVVNVISKPSSPIRAEQSSSSCSPVNMDTNVTKVLANQTSQTFFEPISSSEDEGDSVTSEQTSSYQSPARSVAETVTGIVESVCQQPNVEPMEIDADNNTRETPPNVPTVVSDVDDDEDSHARSSCIKYARKSDDEADTSDTPDQDPQSPPNKIMEHQTDQVSSTSNGNPYVNILHKTPQHATTANGMKTGQRKPVNQQKPKRTTQVKRPARNIWIPEVTTTVREDEVVEIRDFSGSQLALPPPIASLPPMCASPVCYHSCCVIFRQILASLPYWINPSQFLECIQAHLNGGGGHNVPRPIVDEPPESEWPVVNVYNVDPSDGTLRYKCRNCDGVVEQRSIKQKNYLHYGRLKHICQTCNRKYITRKQLRLHSLRHCEKTRVCPHCDKRFLTQAELQNHINTHTREKPYGCPVCFERFSHSSRYYKHIRNQHRKYDCFGCYSKTCATNNPNQQ